MIHAMKLQFSVKQLVRDLEDLKGEMYSFAQLSKLSGVDQRYISSWVQGDADYIRFQHVEKFLDYLHREGVDVSKGCTLTVTNEPEPPKSANWRNRFSQSNDSPCRLRAKMDVGFFTFTHKESRMNFFVRILFLLPIGGSIVAASMIFDLYLRMNTTTGVTFIELAARVVYAVSLAVVPYVIARSVKEMVS